MRRWTGVVWRLAFFVTMGTVVILGMESAAVFSFGSAFPNPQPLGLSAWLQGARGVLGGLVLVAVGILVWAVVGMVRVARVLRYLATSELVLDDTPPPDHPFVDMLRARRATYLGRRTGQLPTGAALTRYDFRTEAGVALVALSAVDGLPGLTANFSTLFKTRPLETLLYPPGVRPPYDDVDTRWLRAVVLCGDDFEAAYLRHMDEVALRYVDDGAPGIAPEGHAAALAWGREQGRAGARYEQFVLLAGPARSVLTYGLVVGMLAYAWRGAYLLGNPALDGSIQMDEWALVIRDVRVYLGGVGLFFLLNLHPEAYYPPFRWVSSGLLGVALAALLVDMDTAYNVPFVYGSFLFMALVVGLAATFWRTFERRRAWRAVRLRPTAAKHKR